MEQIGAAFLQHYYNTFDSNRAMLGQLYQPHSMMTFENSQCLGQEKIVQKLSSLPFTQVIHKVITQDYQPGPVPNSIVIFVTGQFVIDGEMEKPHFFSQFFTLLPTPENSYYIFNDIFRRVSVV